MSIDKIMRLSVSEAARLFGVSQKTIRRAIADKKLNYIVVQGRYKINFESILRWSQQVHATRVKRDTEGIGQFVDKWKIKNKLFSPNPAIVEENTNVG